MLPSIASIVAETFEMPLDAVSDETGPDTLMKWDSLGAVRLLLALQDAFQLEFTQPEILAMRNVALIRRVLVKRGIEAH